LLWLILRKFTGLNPVWAISSMIVASDPMVRTAMKTFHGRIVNSLLGCGVGILVLVIGGSNEWKLPIALSAAAFLSAYVVRVPVMFRQAPNPQPKSSYTDCNRTFSIGLRQAVSIEFLSREIPNSLMASERSS
jgi:Fusaric acid resistance protein-like